MKIELEHKQPFSCSLICNDIFIAKSYKKNKHHFEVNHFPARCKIDIDPWKIRPLIRFDRQLVNYGLAKITPWDHMLEFTIPKDFLSFYFDNILTSKKEYLKLDTNELNKKIGYMQYHNHLIEKIKEKIK